MEITTSGADASNCSSEQSNNSVVSPVPDLVTSMPMLTPNESCSTTSVSSTLAAKPVEVAQCPCACSEPPSAFGKTSNCNQNLPPTSNQSTDNHIPYSTNLNSDSNLPSTGTTRVPSLSPAVKEASIKNRSSREEKSRKKDDKSVDHVLRALNSLNTTEEKLAAMCKKYADIFDEHRKLQLLHKQTEKRCSMLQREKEQLQAEHSKAILTRSRLENLCRELQRQNKAIKDESLLKIREEEEKRKEVSAKFQTTMNEITTLMQQNNDKNMKLRDDNIDMTTKLKNICEQYELRQQQVERISKQMQLEQQLADAKLSKLKMEMAAERELWLREKQHLLLEIQQYQQRCTEFQATEVNLRNQITMYNEKYDEFQKALARSNDVFGGFKGEMEKMSKKICKLEKETSTWKQRWERSHAALLEMAADKQRSEQELRTVSRQLTTLQGLCRTLQTERASLHSKLKELQGGAGDPIEKSSVKPVEKCLKQACEQTLNHVDIEQPVNDPVLVQYNQDILASFKEDVASEDCSPDCTQTASPLPDLVGDTNNCTAEQTAALSDRLGSVSLNPLPSEVPDTVTDSNAAGAQLDQPDNASPETNGCVLQNDTSVGERDDSLSLPINSVETEAPAPPPPPPSQVDDVILTNGVLSGDASTCLHQELQPQPTPSPASPSPQPPSVKGSPAKTPENGKKAKEMTKKKKK